jgi:membrane fusion protein, multidrug efflux system
MAEAAQPQPAAVAATPAPAKSSLLPRFLAISALLLLAGGGYWLYARQFEETDDAQVDGNISAVSPRVAGTGVAVRVVDNQVVKAGDVLVELDPSDLEVQLAQAKASVAQAEAAWAAENPSVAMTKTSNSVSVSNAQDEVENARADLVAAQRDLDQSQAQDKLAQLNLERGKQLLSSQTISQAELDSRQSQADVTHANVAAAQQRIAQRRARLATAEARQHETTANAPRQLVAREANVAVRKANLELAQAQLKQAQLNFGYAKITAPADGVIGKKSVNTGDRVQPGQQLMALTQTGELWVTANFRETQVERMRLGQKTTLHVDAIDRDFAGQVESFAGATGSRYSLLPPENASGNYVKVVQRLPVRVSFDPGQSDLERLRPGLSVEAKVKVR